MLRLTVIQRVLATQSRPAAECVNSSYPGLERPIMASFNCKAQNMFYSDSTARWNQRLYFHLLREIAED